MKNYTGHHTDTVCDFYLMAWHNVRRTVLMGNDPEKISNMQKTKPKSNKRDQEGSAEKLC